jgi:hypothetical protein
MLPILGVIRRFPSIVESFIPQESYRFAVPACGVPTRCAVSLIGARAVSSSPLPCFDALGLHHWENVLRSPQFHSDASTVHS